MRKLIFSLCLLTITIHNAFGQTENLNRLMRERQELIKEYEFYNSQNSNFWGKKSKKDLMHIIEALKGTINKDSEIINEIHSLNLNQQKKQAEITVEKLKIENQVVGDKRVVNDNFYELKNQIQGLENRLKLKQREINGMQERIQEAQEKNLDLQKILALGAVLLLGMVVYTFTLRKKRSPQKR
jgi:hypothetical protein